MLDDQALVVAVKGKGLVVMTGCGHAGVGLVPAHCTGWRAQHAMAAHFPDAFIPNSVGTRFGL